MQTKQAQKFGVLLISLGTPSAPTPKAIRAFLRAFLSDRRVIDTHPWLWQLILNAVILPLRPKIVSSQYQSIWTQAGSPLLVHANEQTKQLQQLMDKELPEQVQVFHAMVYGEPSVSAQLQKMDALQLSRLVVLPLYPQYSSVTTGAAFDVLGTGLKNVLVVPEIRTINHYYDHPTYIDALEQSVQQFWLQQGKGECLLFSFHGIPKQYADRGDPYPTHCQATAQGLANRLALNKHQWAIAYQSKVGPKEWLKPYTDQQLTRWAKQGLKKIDVICPGFSGDCLETLEEIAKRYAKLFKQQSNGGQLRYIPALNSNETHIHMMGQLIKEQSGYWV